MRWKKAAAIAGFVAVAIAGLWTYRDYHQWYDLGQAGVPHNFQGWLQVTYWRAFVAVDPMDQSVFAHEIGKRGDLDLLQISEREGPRPMVDPHPVPHRQITQRSDAATRRALRAMFDSVVARHSDLVYWGPSHVENGNDGVLLRKPDPGNPTIIHTRVWGEIGHIHPVDGSVHLVLSPSDTKKVMDAHWGELHTMVGIRGPLTYTLIYAPRTPQEIAVVQRMLEAAIAYSSYGDNASAPP